MPKKRFGAEQIVTILRQIEVSMAQGKTAPESCRAAGILGAARSARQRACRCQGRRLRPGSPPADSTARVATGAVLRGFCARRGPTPLAPELLRYAGLLSSLVATQVLSRYIVLAAGCQEVLK
jgi:hypothetical protein